MLHLGRDILPIRLAGTVPIMVPLGGMSRAIRKPWIRGRPDQRKEKVAELAASV
jgi:hypothetical protein